MRSGAWEPLENLTLRTIYSRLNRYLKYLFKETAMTGQDRTGQEGSGQERRERISAEIAARTGITEAMIEHLVHAFYAKVRSDPILAPVFAARIADWEPHLAQMCAFWSSVA